MDNQMRLKKTTFKQKNIQHEKIKRKINKNTKGIPKDLRITNT